LSLKGQPLKTAAFLRQRLLRILLPFWTVAWLAYPVLWVIGKSTHTYIPSKWSIFSGITFPLLFEYDGQQLLPTCGPWWFIPLILSFTGVFPLLWKLQQRWGIRNLCGIAALLTIVYRTIAIYLLDGHPTYVMFASNTGAHPFMPFLAKFITFVIGMAVALQYQQWRGALFWPATWALAMGVSIYSVGFLMQFYQAGWILADSCIAVGLSLCCMLLLRFLSDHLHLSRIFRWLGKHSYSFFLIHNFVADRLIRLVVKGDLQAYYTFLPITIGLTLGLAILVDRLTPKIAAHGSQLLYQIDQHLSQPPKSSPPKPFRPMQPISTAVRRQLR
jgi:peptidoglycan/LPS O-acetylase OafA/YrhL